MIAERDRVVLQWTSRARTRDGRPYENGCIAVFTIRQGKIQDVRECMDTLYAHESHSQIIAPGATSSQEASEHAHLPRRGGREGRTAWSGSSQFYGPGAYSATETPPAPDSHRRGGTVDQPTLDADLGIVEVVEQPPPPTNVTIARRTWSNRK
jgi:hypothetical protein